MHDTNDVVHVDVRDDLRQGREPMAKILSAAKSLKPGQSLCLRATFEPIPLFKVLSSMGLDHEAQKLDEGDWQVMFRPGGDASPAKASERQPEADATPQPNAHDWPDASSSLDNRGLTPPEPMVRVLEALEGLGPGTVLEVYNDREPAFLYPELEERGVSVRTERLSHGVRLLLRKGAGTP